MKSDKFSSSLTEKSMKSRVGVVWSFPIDVTDKKKEPQKCVKDMKNVVKHREMNMKAKNLQHKRKEISFRYFNASCDFPIHKFCMFSTFWMFLRAHWGLKSSAAGCAKFSPPKTKELKWHFNRSCCFEWEHVEHKFYNQRCRCWLQKWKLFFILLFSTCRRVFEFMGFMLHKKGEKMEK